MRQPTRRQLFCFAFFEGLILVTHLGHFLLEHLVFPRLIRVIFCHILKLLSRAALRSFGYSGGVNGRKSLRLNATTDSDQGCYVSISPVNTDRIRTVLHGHDLNFGESSDEELAVPTRNAIYFWNTSNPHILQLRAHWRGIANDDAEFASLMEEVRRCNATRTGPKAYLAPFEDGRRYGLIAECDIVATNGLSEAQLDTFFETSMSMIMGFFSDLEETLPEFVTWSDEDSDQESSSEANTISLHQGDRS